MTARWHLYSGDDLDALQHCRNQRGRDPIIAEAALASDSQESRGNQLAQMAARRRARYVGAVSKLSGRQRPATHKGIKHRRSRRGKVAILPSISLHSRLTWLFEIPVMPIALTSSST